MIWPSWGAIKWLRTILIYCCLCWAIETWWAKFWFKCLLWTICSIFARLRIDRGSRTEMTFWTVYAAIQIWNCNIRIVGSCWTFNWRNNVCCRTIISLRASKTHIIRNSSAVAEITWRACYTIFNLGLNSIRVVCFFGTSFRILLSCTIIPFRADKLWYTTFKAVKTLLAVLAVSHVLCTSLKRSRSSRANCGINRTCSTIVTYGAKLWILVLWVGTLITVESNRTISRNDTILAVFSSRACCTLITRLKFGSVAIFSKRALIRFLSFAWAVVSQRAF